MEVTHTTQAAETPCFRADVHRLPLGTREIVGIAGEKERQPLRL
jgi:hypothetical protein